MRKLRVTAAMKKRLVDERCTSGRAQRGGVMVIPKMMRPDVWESLALATQEKLVADARDSIPLIDNSPLAVGDDVSHRYKESPEITRSKEKGGQKRRPFSAG